MLRRTLLVALLFAAAPLLNAQTAQPAQDKNDLTGTWAGSFVITMDGQTNDEHAHMVFKHKGAELTGTAGPNADQQWEILKGKVDAGKVEFDVQSNGPLIHFTLKMVEGRLKGDASAEQDGRKMTAVVDVARQN